MTDNRLNVSHCLVTWARAVNCTKEGLAHHLFDLKSVKAVKVAEEKHQDGVRHFHAYVVFHKRFKFNQATYFNYLGYQANVKIFKPGEKPGYTREPVEYLDKEDENPISLPEGYAFLVPNKRSFKDVAGDAIQAGSKKEAIDLIIAENPDKYLIYGRQIKDNLADFFKPERPRFKPRPLDSFRIPAAITNWISGNLQHPRPERPLSLILVGDSRLGKTQLARSIGDHVYVSGMWAVDDFVGWDWSGYVVFDDIPWDSLKYSYKSWMGAQRHFYVTDKYRKKCLMEGGVPLIMCCNQKEYAEYQANWDSDWVFYNSVVVTIGEKLF